MLMRRLEKLAEPLRARGLKVSVAAVWDFPPYEAVIRRAMAIGADLIVAQKRGHHRLPALLGYTDWELLRASPVPVLLIKQARPRPRAAVLAAVDPQHAGRGSGALEQRILTNAAALAAALRAPLHAVQVLTPGAKPGAVARASALTGLVRSAIGQAGAHAPVARQSGRAAAGDGAPPARGTVVMGMMSRRGLKRLFIGNSAERLLDDLHCDVLVVKPPRFPVRVPRTRRGVYFLTSPADELRSRSATCTHDPMLGAAELAQCKTSATPAAARAARRACWTSGRPPLATHRNLPRRKCTISRTRRSPASSPTCAAWPATRCKRKLDGGARRATPDRRGPVTVVARIATAEIGRERLLAQPSAGAMHPLPGAR